MIRLLFIFMVFCSTLSYGQGYVNYGASRAQDTSRTLGNTLIMGAVRLYTYSNNDTNKVFGPDASGKMVLRTKSTGSGTDTTSLSNRINAKLDSNRKVQNLNSPNALDVPSTAAVNGALAAYSTTTQMNTALGLKVSKIDSNLYGSYITPTYFYANLPTQTTYSAGVNLGLSGNAFYLDTGANKAATKTDLLSYKRANDSTGATGFSTVYGRDTASANNRANTAASVSGLVPYTGATTNVDLGVHSITATRLNSDTLEPRTSAGLHLHNSSHQDIFIAGAGGGQNLTIYAPTNFDLLKNQSTTDTVLTTNSSGTISKIGIGTVYAKVVADTTISANYTLTALDNRRTIHCTNGSNINVTIPTGLAVTFKCDVFQEGAGNVVFVASSTTLNFVPTGTTKTLKLGAGVYIGSFATANNFTVQGALQP
jgi:hypothetical protein